MESRQRESSAALLKRAERIAQFPAPAQPTVITLDNTGAIEIAGERLLEIFSA
jgi:ribose 1,5-bisphosphokinase PhnN